MRYDDRNRPTATSTSTARTARRRKWKTTIWAESPATDYDQADRPCQSELKETATGKILYRTLLKYDKFSNLEQFTEKTGNEIHTSKYAYDRDNRVTEIQYDGAAQKVVLHLRRSRQSHHQNRGMRQRSG